VREFGIEHVETQLAVLRHVSLRRNELELRFGIDEGRISRAEAIRSTWMPRRVTRSVPSARGLASAGAAGGSRPQPCFEVRQRGLRLGPAVRLEEVDPVVWSSRLWRASGVGAAILPGRGAAPPVELPRPLAHLRGESTAVLVPRTPEGSTRSTARTLVELGHPDACFAAAGHRDCRYPAELREERLAEG
jgi:hypothetical protein